MSVEKVNLSIGDDYLDHFAEVVRRVKAAGLNVEQQLEGIGVISGSIESALLADLGKVRGVAAVERSRDVGIAPPHSPVQ